MLRFHAMIPTTDEHKFWQSTSAAPDIFRYRREHADVKDGPWGFDRGGVSDDKSSAWAVFSHVALSGWAKDVLTISAKAQADGSWALAHDIKRAA